MRKIIIIGLYITVAFSTSKSTCVFLCVYICYVCVCVFFYLILGGAEQVVSGGVEGEPGDARLVSPHHLDTVAPGNGPHADSAVWRGREHYRLEGRE